MATALRALVFGIWSLVHPGHLPPDAEPIATAIVQAVIDDADNTPALGSHAEDLVALALWAERESRIQIAPAAFSWDAVARLSCGPWQEPCAYRTHSLRWQATYWLRFLHWGAEHCPESPAAPLSSGSCQRGRQLADGRLREARWLLSTYVLPPLE